MATTIGNLLVNMRLNTAEFDKGMKSAQSRLTKVGSTFNRLGSDLTRSVSLPLIGMGAAILKTGSDFESAFAGVKKTANATKPELDELRAGFRAMARELPASAAELSAIGEAAGQLGIETENILSFTRVMADLGATTNLSSTEAATSLARFSNIMGTSQGDIDRLGSTIVHLGNNFATTESEITEMALRIAGAGRQVGLTEAEVLSFAAALSSVGIQAEAGGTAISRIFVDIEKAVATGSGALDDFAGVVNMSADQFATAFKQDAAGTLSLFITELGRLQESGGSISVVLEQLGLDGIRVGDVLKRSAGAGDLLNKSLTEGSAAFAENQALTEEARQRYETFASQVQRLRDEFIDIGITLFDSFRPILVDTVIPLVRSFAEVVAGLANRFAQLPEPVKTFTLALVALAAAAGPVLYFMGQWIFSIKNILPLLPGLGKAVVAVTKGAFTPWGLAIAGIVAALTDTISRLNEFEIKSMSASKALESSRVSFSDAIRNGLNPLGAAVNSVNNSINIAIGLWNDYGDYLKNAFTKVLQVVADVWAKMWAGMKSVVSSGVERIKGLITGFTDGVIDRFRRMYDAVVGNSFVPDMMDRIQLEFGRLPDIMVRPSQRTTMATTLNFGSMFDQVKSMAKDWRGSLVSAFGGVVDALLSGKGLKDSFKSSLGGLFGQFKGAFDSIVSAAKNWKDTLSGIFSSVVQGLLSGKGLKGSLLQSFGGLFGNLGGLGGSFPGGLGSGPLGGLGGNQPGGLFGLLGGLFKGGGIGGQSLSQLIPSSLISSSSTLLASETGVAGATAASGGGGIFSSLGSFFTNPWTIGIGALLAGGFALSKILKNPKRLGAKETLRDFGVDIGKGDIGNFLKSFGISTKEFEPIRKDVLSSPAFFKNVLLPQAQASGQVDQLIASFGKLEAFGRSFDLSAEAAAAVAGDFSKLNDRWAELFGSGGLPQFLPTWESLLVQTTDKVLDAVEKGKEALAGMEGGDTARSFPTLSVDELRQRFPGQFTHGASGIDALSRFAAQQEEREREGWLGRRGADVFFPGGDLAKSSNVQNLDPRIELNVTINAKDPDLTNAVRDQIVPELQLMLRTGSRGLIEDIVRAQERARFGVRS